MYCNSESDVFLISQLFSPAYCLRGGVGWGGGLSCWKTVTFLSVAVRSTVNTEMCFLLLIVCCCCYFIFLLDCICCLLIVLWFVFAVCWLLLSVFVVCLPSYCPFLLSVDCYCPFCCLLIVLWSGGVVQNFACDFSTCVLNWCKKKKKKKKKKDRLPFHHHHHPSPSYTDLNTKQC